MFMTTIVTRIYIIAKFRKIFGIGVLEGDYHTPRTYYILSLKYILPCPQKINIVIKIQIINNRHKNWVPIKKF